MTWTAREFRDWYGRLGYTHFSQAAHDLCIHKSAFYTLWNGKRPIPRRIIRCAVYIEAIRKKRLELAAPFLSEINGDCRESRR